MGPTGKSLNATTPERVSVVVATYNGERFLAEQLASLSDQRRPPSEIVIVDDASTDGTVEMLRAFAASAPCHVDLVARTEHLGTAATFAEAIGRTTGDIVMICDQDDRWREDKVDLLAERLAAHPDALLAFSDSQLIDVSGAPIGRSRWRVSGFSAQEQAAMSADSFGQMVFRQIVSGCTAAFRSELIGALLPFPTEVHPSLPDMIYDRWTSLLAAAGGPIVVVPEQLVEYRIHPGQQIGIPALMIRRMAPKAVLQLSQFLVNRDEMDQRHEYLLNHLEVIQKRLTAGGLASPASEQRIALADEHLRRRQALGAERTDRIGPVVGEYRRRDGSRRFSLGLATAVADTVR